MLNHWLSPVNINNIIPFDALSDYQLGKTIKIYQQDFPDLEKVKLAFIGIDEEPADEIRSHLYSMSNYHSDLPFADLGNIQKIHPEVIIPLICELIESKIIPIIIGKHRAYTYTQYMAYQKLEQLVSAVVIDERIPYTFDDTKKEKDFYYLNQILDKKDHCLFNLSMVGYQSHFTDNNIVRLFQDKGYGLDRLGQVKYNLDEIEPTLRDADFISFDISAIKYADAPGIPFPSPSGIFGEEASQLTHFAGMSEKLTSIGFYGYHPKFDNRGQTAQLIAQMIWYFVDGFCKRNNDLPIDNQQFTNYQVPIKNSNYDITFWRSNRTERWWMQIPVEVPDNKKRHRIVPCSMKDYQLACQDEIPERFLNAFKRFDGYSH